MVVVTVVENKRKDEKREDKRGEEEQENNWVYDLRTPLWVADLSLVMLFLINVKFFCGI